MVFGIEENWKFPAIIGNFCQLDLRDARLRFNSKIVKFNLTVYSARIDGENKFQIIFGRHVLAPSFQFSPFVEEQRRFAMLMLKCTFQKNKVKEAVNFVDKSGNKLQFLILYNRMVLKK